MNLPLRMPQQKVVFMASADEFISEFSIVRYIETLMSLHFARL